MTTEKKALKIAHSPFRKKGTKKKAPNAISTTFYYHNALKI